MSASPLDPDDGFEVTLHQSLVVPILVAGLPRTVAYLLWTTTIAMAFGARELWFLAFGGILHIGCSMVTRHDPHFFEVFITTLKNQDRLEP